MSPQLLIVGHIVKDITDDGWVPGGGAYYAAAQAHQLGRDVAMVTACDVEIDPAKLVPAAQWHTIALENALRFQNTYTGGTRHQRVFPVTRQLMLDDIPPAWRDTPVMLLTPVFHDVDPALPSQLAGPSRLLGIGAQGWLRHSNEDGVTPGNIEDRPPWLHGDAVFLSTEDAHRPEQAASWHPHVPNVVLTRGKAGYTIWNCAGRNDIPASAANEVDPTGAGDVFAVAFLVRFAETRDANQSACFAAAAAALSVESTGISSIGDRSAIEARLRHAKVST